MKNLVKMSIAVMGILLVATSCESESVAEQEQLYEDVSKKDFIETINPMGEVTPSKIRRPGNAAKQVFWHILGPAFGPYHVRR